ncbi:MAG TPA: metal-dependent transcriptional regulator [Acidobacteriaceae bacterium]|nr:metal-dependent transcriptional regulator [Acidobacteriaceae bacterium]
MTSVSGAAISVSKEDYLKAILEAESEGQTVISATLAHWLKVSAPAVSMALRRLKRDGFVEVKADGVVRLTDEGREAAYRTALRHHLIERMLSEMFGMPWYEVHHEAERLEHAVSPAFEALLMKKLGEKGTCPHGNLVLPETPEKRLRRGVRPLADVAEGARYTVTSLFERDEKLLRFLHQTGIEPGGTVKVVRRNYDQTVAIETAMGTFTIGPAAAENVHVRRADAKRGR